jgi:hypothetical protein
LGELTPLPMNRVRWYVGRWNPIGNVRRYYGLCVQVMGNDMRSGPRSKVPLNQKRAQNPHLSTIYAILIRLSVKWWSIDL